MFGLLGSVTHLFSYSHFTLAVSLQHYSLVTNSEALHLFNRHSRSFRVLTGHSEIILCADSPNMVNITASSEKSDKSLYPVIATGSKDKTARIWATYPDPSNSKQVPFGVCVGICEGHTEAVGAIALPNKARFHYIPSLILIYDIEY